MMNQSEINVAAEQIIVTTIGGRRFDLRPVKMAKMPSEEDPAEWLKFLRAHVPGTELSEQMASQIQLYMRVHRTEALTDGVENYTIAGCGLAYCDPDAIDRETERQRG